MKDEEPATNKLVEIVRLFQDAPPTHYTTKIKSFQAFSEIKKQQPPPAVIYESQNFEVGGHNWKLLCYPSEKMKKEGSEEYISLSVAIADAPTNCVTAMLRLFVYNQAKDKYLAVQDWKARRYHSLKTEHGFDQVLPLAEFLDLKSGYLVDDCCLFGAEVHVIESARKMHSSILTNYLERGVYQWKIDNFSEFKELFRYSNAFPVGPCNWKIQLYPNGNGDGKGNSISVFLCKCDDVKGQTVYAKVKITLHRQKRGNNHTFEGHRRFDDKNHAWGCAKFISLADLRDRSNGYLKKNALIIEASIEAYFSQPSES